MTRLPFDSWNIRPRLDLAPYELNTVCPITGETEGLEDHHIWRRSFTALGKEDNERLYWVEAWDEGHEQSIVLPNRIALHASAHQRITTNIANLRFEEGRWYYEEAGSRKELDLRMHLMAGEEKVSKPRRKRGARIEDPKERKVYSIRTPANEANVLPEICDALRDKYAPQMGWQEDVPDYYVWATVGAKDLQEL